MPEADPLLPLTATAARIVHTVVLTMTTTRELVETKRVRGDTRSASEMPGSRLLCQLSDGLIDAKSIVIGPGSLPRKASVPLYIRAFPTPCGWSPPDASVQPPPDYLQPNRLATARCVKPLSHP